MLVLRVGSFSLGWGRQVLEWRTTVPWSRVRTFTDPFPFQATIRAADLEFFPTASGKFRGELTQVCMNKLWMQRFYHSLPQVVAGSMRPGRRVISFLTGAKPTEMQHCGLDVLPGDIIVNNSEALHQKIGAGFHFAGMSLATDDFDAACEALAGRQCSATALPSLVRPSPALMSRLQKLHKTVGQMAQNTPSILVLPEVVRSLEQQLIHLMVRCLTDGAFSGMTTAGQRRYSAVARLEALLEAYPDKPFHLPEICAAIGVEERTLRSACHEHLGMSPMRFLALRRMHLVRRALLRADSSTTVTRVAIDLGFWELGRFAVNYRALFGETPSATLRRSPDDRRVFLNHPTSLVRPDLYTVH